MAGTIIRRVRHHSGLSQRELARRAGTSQSTLSAYEHGTKSPTLAVAERIANAGGYALDLAPQVKFTAHDGARGEPFVVPDRLWRLDVEDALATVTLPLHLHWSGPPRKFHLDQRRDRARLYEIVLREGGPEDLLALVDGALLVDLWDELVLLARVREVWGAVIVRVRLGS